MRDNLIKLILKNPASSTGRRGVRFPLLPRVKNKKEVKMPAKLDRCVKKVKKKGKVRNAWAVCKAAFKKKKKAKKK